MPPHPEPACGSIAVGTQALAKGLNTSMLAVTGHDPRCPAAQTRSQNSKSCATSPHGVLQKVPTQELHFTVSQDLVLVGLVSYAIAVASHSESHSMNANPTMMQMQKTRSTIATCGCSFVRSSTGPRRCTASTSISGVARHQHPSGRRGPAPRSRTNHPCCPRVTKKAGIISNQKASAATASTRTAAAMRLSCASSIRMLYQL